MIEKTKCPFYPLHLAASILVKFFDILLYQSGQGYGYFWQVKATKVLVI